MSEPSAPSGPFSEALQADLTVGRVSHQGLEGWFPECINRGMGNLGGVVCLRPDHVPADLPSKDAPGQLSELQHLDGHWWKSCVICDARIFADPWSWGVYALCLSCAWLYEKSGADWPTTADPKARRIYPDDHPLGCGPVRIAPRPR